MPGCCSFVFIIVCPHPKEIPPSHAAAALFHAPFYRKNLNYKIWEASASVEIWEPCLPPPFLHITYFNKSIACPSAFYMSNCTQFISKASQSQAVKLWSPNSPSEAVNVLQADLTRKLILNHCFLLCHLLKIVSILGHGSGLQGEFRSPTKPLQVLPGKPKWSWWGAWFYVCLA